jgi:lysylphosphatidylglycerol synthetase-like protein (DUF2156 family)
MNLPALVFGSTTSTCIAPRGEGCSSPGAISAGVALLLVVVVGLFVYVAVSISNRSTKEPPQRRRDKPLPTRTVGAALVTVALIGLVVALLG